MTDAAVLPQLLEQIPAEELLLTVIGDGAYDTQPPVHAALIERNATPIIHPRKNARMRKGDTFAHRNAAIAACKRFGRKLWKSWSGYHRGSLVKTKMHCIKRLGKRVMSRTLDWQVNELHIRAAILNQFTELGRPQTVALTKPRLGLGRSCLELINATAPLRCRRSPAARRGRRLALRTLILENNTMAQPLPRHIAYLLHAKPWTYHVQLCTGGPKLGQSNSPIPARAPPESLMRACAGASPRGLQTCLKVTHRNRVVSWVARQIQPAFQTNNTLS